MDRLEAMQAFVVTVDRGSLSKAAQALGRSITAVSRALTALEERLGVRLLTRTTRALKLTDAGARYLRALLEKYENDPHQVSKAVAAYNAGPAAVDKYDGVPPYAETTQYVKRVLKQYEKEQARQKAD